MDPSDVATIITIFILLLLSAFFSSAETALTTVGRMKIRSMAEEGNKKAKTVMKLIEDPTKMLSAILICNNVVNLSASSISTSFAYKICRNYLHMEGSTSLAAGIATGILTILVLIFGEITPKSLATVYSEKLALLYCNVVYFVTQLLTPFVFLVNIISTVLLKIFKIDLNAHGDKMTEDELMTIFDVSHEDGVIESEEHEMITNIVEFGDSLVKDVMVPRMDVEAVADDLSYDELMESFSHHKFSRLPVYSDTIDNIIGTLFDPMKYILLSFWQSIFVDKSLKAKLLGYQDFDNYDEVGVFTKGYRVLNKIPRMPNVIVNNLVKNFKSFQHILLADVDKLDEVEGIGEVRARTIKQSLRRMQEQFVFENSML